MLDRHSNYALNKVDKEAIICPCATGEHTRLVREDFSSEEEFLSWKKWSDENYHETELASRKDDSWVSFEAQQDAMTLSAEEIIFAPYMGAERVEQHQRLMACLKNLLTEKQYRRMCLYYLEGKGEAGIASAEGVHQSSVSRSIRSGAKKSRTIF